MEEEFEKKGLEGGSENKSKSKGRRGQGQEKVKRDDGVCWCAAEVSRLVRRELMRTLRWTSKQAGAGRPHGAHEETDGTLDRKCDKGPAGMLHSTAWHGDGHG